MAEEPMVLMVVKGDKGAPTLSDAARQLNVPVEDLDASFGVVAVDPNKGLYSVRVRADHLKPGESSEYRGPFSDPKIEPMGPLK
jgi:hypothetical protein